MVKSASNSFSSLPTADDKLNEMYNLIRTEAGNARVRHSEVTKQLDVINSRIDKMELKVNQIDINNRNVKNEVQILQQQVNSLKQDALSTDIMIRNIPEDNSYEDKLVEIVQLLLQEMKYTKPVNICPVQRVGTLVESEKRQQRPIIVKFASRSEMNDILSAKKKVIINCSQVLYGNKPIGTADQVIYFDERLTKANSDLYYQARLLRKKGVVKYAWLRNGVVHVRRSDSSSAVKILDQQQCRALEKKRKMNSTTNEDNDSSGQSDDDNEVMDVSSITSPAAKQSRDDSIPIAKRKGGRKCKNKKDKKGNTAVQPT